MAFARLRLAARRFRGLLEHQRELCRRLGGTAAARCIRGPIRAPLRARGTALAVFAPAAQRARLGIEYRLAADLVDQRARLGGELAELLGRARGDERAPLAQIAPDEPHRPLRAEPRADADLVQRELPIPVHLL